MAQNTASPDSHEIPLTVLSGLVTYFDPVSIPQGVSPDCADVSFAPGSVKSRPAFKRLFASPVYPYATCVYGKSYVDPKGVIRNLYLYSNGGMTVEFPQTTPGTETALLDNNGSPVFVPRGSQMKSITAFGREWLAPADGLHGTDIPLQYDGTYLDRVTQDGPGSSPSVASLIIPSVALANLATPPTLTITGIFPDQRIGGASGPFTVLNIYVTATPELAVVGSSITLSGLGGSFSVFNGTYTVITNPGPDGAIVVSFYYAGSVSGTASGTLTILGGGKSLIRTANIVTATTTSAHHLQIGYQVQISGVAAGIIGTGISSIVINNEDSPGIATVTTSTAHGLVPGLKVSISGVVSATVGTVITSIVRAGQIVTVICSATTGLSPGGIVTISGVPTGSFNTTTTILNVTTTTVAGDTFTYSQVDVDASDSSGTIGLNWPIPNTPTPSYFEVIAAPTPTTFQVGINYADGTWTTGTVSYAWDGTFFVESIPTSTTFTYKQYGPDQTSGYSSGQIATPHGQCSPGQHQMQVFFVTRSGFTTAPSPPVTFVANGGQYISVTNIPIGPANVVARAIAFTGAQGAYFFYIPAPPQVAGQIVGTATQINDNTTENAVFDFGDPTLFNSTGISVPGNNLANQVVLDGTLGFGFYGSRLWTYGQRNIIGNLLNMGFDGGYLPSTVSMTNPNGLPTGWSYASTGGNLESGHYGSGWLISTTAGGGSYGILTQSLYQDYVGSPIALAATQYKIRVWLKPSVAVSTLHFTVAMTSASASFSATATIAGNLMNPKGGWLEANFSAKTPAVIPADFTLSVYASSTVSNRTILIDELSIILSDSPYLRTMFSSYANNPEAFDGVTGILGPVNDTHPVLDLAILRDNLYMGTQDPEGRLHETSQGIGEPAGWTVNEVAANCGLVSAYTMTRSQASDDTAAGGEDWYAWQSATGIRIFWGQQPEVISREIQRPKGRIPPGAPQDLGALNPNALLTCWGLNDPSQQIMYFGMPTNSATKPDIIYVLTYTGMNSAEEIAAGSSVHHSLAGKITASDLKRKWCPWRLPVNGAALMFRGSGNIETVFFGG